MTESEVLDLLQKVGAFRAGHFVFTSGRHGDSYVNKDALYPYTHDTSLLCKVMAERFADKDIEVVVGPTMGAAILAQLVAYHLSELTGPPPRGGGRGGRHAPSPQKKQKIACLSNRPLSWGRGGPTKTKRGSLVLGGRRSQKPRSRGL